MFGGFLQSKLGAAAAAVESNVAAAMKLMIPASHSDSRERRGLMAQPLPESPADRVTLPACVARFRVGLVDPHQCSLTVI